MKLLRAGIIGALCLSTALLVGCSKTLNTDDVEGQISSGLTEQVGGEFTVDCPADPPAEAGGTFECTATSAEGQTATITVTQDDAEGNLSWEVTAVTE